MTVIYKQPNLIAADPHRPLYNVGAGLDIPTGEFIVGLYGEMINNGGLAPLTGIAAKPNYFKTALATHFQLSVMDVFEESTGGMYDTESSLRDRRIRELSLRFPTLAGMDLFALDNMRFQITNKDNYMGDEWFDAIREFMMAKRKDRKNLLRRSPFPDRTGKANMMIMQPNMFGADSLTEFFTQGVADTLEEHGLSDSKRNMTAMNNGRAKAQMISELSQLASGSACPTILSAHIGDKIGIDGAPPEKVMQYLKQGTKILGVTGKFMYLTNNCWFIVKADNYLSKDRAGAELPREGETNVKGETDLVELTICNLRGKAGAAGVPMTVLASQSEGVLSSLTEFQSLRANAYYGLEGGTSNYECVFKPGVRLSRTTVRTKLDNDPTLQRAIQFASEMRQIERFMGRQYANYFCTPQELFRSLKEKGYDWDELLATRGKWTTDNDKHPVPYLSTLDLLRMRVDEYKPYWKQ